MTKGIKDWKVWVGFAFAFLCLYLAFRKVDLAQMAAAFRRMNVLMLLPILAVIFFSHWLRALRWRYFLNSTARLDMNILFSALMIGYMTNNFLPAHLGEVVRAFIVARRRSVAGGTVFATIVIERLLDAFTLLLLAALTLLVFPFPDWVRKSGIITLAVLILLLAFLMWMKRHRAAAIRLIERLFSPLSARLSSRLVHLLGSFLDGLTALQRKRDYLIVAVLSVVIWFCYGFVFRLGLAAFGFDKLYNLPWTASLVLLVITTIAVVVPSSPGYVGTYHYLCQLALGLYNVPPGEALSFAFVIHGINFLPVLLVGLIILSLMGLSLKTVQRQAEHFEEETESLTS